MMGTMEICLDFNIYNKTQVVVFYGGYSMDCSQTLISILRGLYIQLMPIWHPWGN